MLNHRFVSWIGLMVLACPPAEVIAQASIVPGDPPLAFWTRGPLNDVPVIVVVHGGPALTHDYLVPEWETLARSHRVVFYDQRGCGGSAKADSYGWREHVADLRRLIHEVSPERPVVLAGSSWGATVALYYSLEHEQELAGVILSGLGAPRVWTRPGSDQAIGPYNDIDLKRAAKEQARSLAALDDRLVRCDDVWEGTVSSLVDVPKPWRLYELTLPVLFFPDNRFGRTFVESASSPEREGSFRIVVGGGHDPWYWEPEIFFDEVSEFLTELAVGRPGNDL